MADARQGYEARLSMGAVGTAVGSFTESHEFLSETLRLQGEIVDANGIRGVRGHTSERTRPGNNRIEGAIVYNPSPDVLDLLLPRILGGTKSGDTIALAESLPEFDVLIDRGERRFLYGSCRVSRATFRASAGQPLELTLDLLGKTETVSSTAFPSITAPTDPPYMFSDCVFTLVAATREHTDFELVIDNGLVARYVNSVNATSITPQDRTVTYRATVPYNSDNLALYAQSAAGAAASIVATNGTRSVTFTLGRLQCPPASPNISGRSEVLLTVEGTARRVGSTAELVVVNDSTA